MSKINIQSRFSQIGIPIFKWKYYLILAFAVFVVIKQIKLLLPIIIADGMAEARGSLGDVDIILTGFWPVLLAYFAKPFLMASLIVLMIKFFNRGGTFIDVIIFISLCIVYFFSEGGRLFLMDLVFCVIYLIFKYKDIISKTNIKKVKYVIGIFVIAVILTTLQRGSDILDNLNSYYCGSLAYLDNFLDSSEASSVNYLYGMTSYQGFFSPIFGLLGICGIDKPEILVNATDFIMHCQHTIYPISSTNSINYYATCFGYAYHDGGIIGMMLVMFFYGVLSVVIDNNERKYYNSIFWLSIKCIFVYTTLFTMAVFPFAKYLYPMTMFFVWILLKYFTKINLPTYE